MKILTTSFATLYLLIQGHLTFAANDNMNCAEAELHKQFLIMNKTDQDVRNDYMATRGTYGNEDPQAQKIRIAEIAKKMQTIDKSNQDRLTSIVNECGWPVAAQFNNSSLAAALTIIVHAPLEYQETYFPLVKASFNRGEVPGTIFSKLTDRMALHRKIKAMDELK